MEENKLSTFTQNDYEIVKREVLYQGIFRMARYAVRFRLYQGGFSDILIREVLERNPSAGVLPYDPVTDKVILIEQFRVGAMANPTSPWLIEIVAGTFNKDEKAPASAIREGKEEAGCDILDLYPICGYFVSPGGCNEYIHLFCGRVDASKAGGFFGLADEGEDIRAFTLPAEEAFELLQRGDIKTSPTIISLQWLQLNRQWLKQLWQTK